MHLYLMFFNFGNMCWTKPTTMKAFQSTLNSLIISYCMINGHVIIYGIT